MNETESQAVVVRDAQELAPTPMPIAPVSLFGTSDPVAVVEKASAVASALKDVVRKQGLITNIQGKEYPRCEAWTLCGSMLGVFPVLVWTKPIEGGWEARVEAKTINGNVVGAAEAECLRSERNWGNRDDYALRSMAQTRATAKALRMPLGFVMSLAGYEVTPAEEITAEMVTETRKNHSGRVQTPPKPEKRAVAQTDTQYKASADELPMDGKTPLAKDQEQADKATLLTTLRRLAGGNEKYFVDFLRENKTKQGTYTLMPNEGMEDLSLDMLRYCVNNFAEFSDKVSQWVADKAGVQGERSDNNDLPEGTKSITGELAMVTVREGTTRNKVWTRYGLTVNGMEMGCFDKTTGAIAQKIKGKQVRIDYEENEKGNNVLRLTEVLV